MKTGEEDEEEIFAERSKLFRFTNGEWKERGLGVMKILKHPHTGESTFSFCHKYEGWKWMVLSGPRRIFGLTQCSVTVSFFSPGRYRLLMRREQVLKICCNHLLGPEIVLRPMANSDKAWVWHALDASEDEVRLGELF